MFRATHDAFGHSATGGDFSPAGEEMAWFHHCQMYSPAARPAMTAETRAINYACTLACGGEFPPQRAAYISPEFFMPQSVGFATDRPASLH
jgi:hypothetical protein